MKALRKPDRRETERVAQAVSDVFTDALDDTKAQLICMTCRFFGLGKKRANDFLIFCLETSNEFKQYIEDGILTDKLKEELVEHGIDPNKIYSEKEDIAYQTHMIKKKKNTQATFAESLKAKKNIQALKRILKDQEDSL